MNIIVSGALFLVAVIHLLPVLGVLGGERLLALYGVQYSDSNSLILMRHRAVLFGILGVFIMIAAFSVSLQWWAIFMAGASTLSFVLLAHITPAHNAQIDKVVSVDLVAIVALLVAVGARLLQYR